LQRLCNSGDGWHRREGAPATRLVFPCLVRNLYNEDDDDEEKDGNNADEKEDEEDDEDSDKLDADKDSEALSPGCADQVGVTIRFIRNDVTFPWCGDVTLLVSSRMTSCTLL
jgi:hypothetical protein